MICRCRYCPAELPSPHEILKHYKADHAEEYAADLQKRQRRPMSRLPAGYVLVKRETMLDANATAQMAEAFINLRVNEDLAERFQRRNHLRTACEFFGLDFEKIVAFLGSPKLLPEDCFEKKDEVKQ